jgi:hypothetical protein
MKTTPPSVLLALFALCGCSTGIPTTLQPESTWSTYVNDKYGYSIQYPQGYDLWATGREGARDGATIRIGLKEYEAPAPVLDIQIEPRTPKDQFPSLPIQLSQMTASVTEVQLKGIPASIAEYRWKVTKELAFVEVYYAGVVFRFTAASGLNDFQETPWWAIITTFRFREGQVACSAC